MTTSTKNRFYLFLFLIILSIVVIFGLKFLFPYFMPFIIAYGFAKYAYPISLCLNKRFHFPKSLACVVTLTLFMSIVGVLIYYFTITLIGQLDTVITNLPIYRKNLLNQIYDLCHQCDCAFQMKHGTTKEYFFSLLASFSNIKDTALIPTLTKQTVGFMMQTVKLMYWVFICIFTALLIILDYEGLREKYRKIIFYKDINRILDKLSVTGLRYLKMQFVIIGVIAILCTIGLFIIKNPYALLLGVVIALLDALPLFGSGTILVPWAIIKLFSHNIPEAAILMTTYLLCQVTRQFLESKLLGDSLGLPSVYFVMSLFIGLEIYGVIGFLLGPFSLLLIKIIYTTYKPCFLRCFSRDRK